MGRGQMGWSTPRTGTVLPDPLKALPWLAGSGTIGLIGEQNTEFSDLSHVHLADGGGGGALMIDVCGSFMFHTTVI